MDRPAWTGTVFWGFISGSRGLSVFLTVDRRRIVTAVLFAAQDLLFVFARGKTASFAGKAIGASLSADPDQAFSAGDRIPQQTGCDQKYDHCAGDNGQSDQNMIDIDIALEEHDIPCIIK